MVLNSRLFLFYNFIALCIAVATDEKLILSVKFTISELIHIKCFTIIQITINHRFKKVRNIKLMI